MVYPALRQRGRRGRRPYRTRDPVRQARTKLGEYDPHFINRGVTLTGSDVSIEDQVIKNGQVLRLAEFHAKFNTGLMKQLVPSMIVRPQAFLTVTFTRSVQFNRKYKIKG
jgi:hypothetical protein